MLCYSRQACIGPTLVYKLKIHRWCVDEVAMLGQQQYVNCSNFSIGPTFGQYQHANNDVLHTTPSHSNVGSTNACYL